MTDVRFGVLVGVLVGVCVAGSAQAQTTRSVFNNATPNAIPDLGPAASYPSTISVSGITGVTYHVMVTVTLTHTFPSDVDIVLKAPNGRKVMLFSDIGGDEGWIERAIVFDDCAPLALRPGFLSSGRYRPGNASFGGYMPPPGPLSPHGTTLSEFNWTNPNGNWELYVADAIDGEGGVIDSWTLTLFTQPLAGAPIDTTGVNPISCAKPDYDGDGRSDIGVYRPETGQWLILQSGSSAGVITVSWGAPASSGTDDIAVAADYDGDGLTDLGVYRRTTGDWWVRTAVGATLHTNFGAPSSSGVDDRPVPGDYDGDGKADRAVYRASQGTWWVLSSASGSSTPTQWGHPPSGDYPAR